jgi:hypothetical protein
MNKKIHNMAVFIEFLTGSGLAIFFHLVLHHAEAAYIIFGVGVLLSLATWLLREDIEGAKERLLDQYQHAHEITFALAGMTDPECRAKAHEIMAGTKRSLALLQQGYVPFDETEFYMKGAKYLDASSRRVRAVDPVTVGWDSRGALLNYYQANLRALERGVQIIRVFVIAREELTEPEVQRLLHSQLKDGVDVRVAFRDELPTAGDSSGRDTESSFDFALYDDQVVTEVYSQPGRYFGRKTRVPALVASYQRLFDLIEHSSHAVAAEEERVVLAADLLLLAS